MAGVMTPSPSSRDTPMNVRIPAKEMARADLRWESRISRSTISPPCPLRDRLVASQAYSTVTRIVRVQKTSESIPRTLS